jgi:heptose I phosphotransferase
MITFFRPDFYNDLNAKDPFETLMQQEGHIYRHVKGRKTIRFVLNNKVYFAKIFYGISIGEVIKNLIKAQIPVADVSHERQALEKLTSLGIDVPQVVAYGNDEANLLHRRSFIVMEAVEPSISLEDYLHAWKDKPLLIRRELIKKVAQIARAVHQHGIHHRDFYICHFLLKTPNDENTLSCENLELALIDWHRARFKKSLPQSWQIKDLAALYFSVMSASLTRRDYLRFLQVYTQRPLREVFKNTLWDKVNNRALRLYKKIYFPQGFYKRILTSQDTPSPELLAVLSDPESIFTRAQATIIKKGLHSTLVKFNVDGRDIVIKRYPLRKGWLGFTQLFRTSRAARSWHYAHLLLANNIATPMPLALVEKRWGFLRRDSYYIMEYSDGISLGDYMSQISTQTTHSSDEAQKLFTEWQTIHQQLLAAKITHGDSSHQNYLVTRNGLQVLDLDTMRQHFITWNLARRQQRDQSRFMKVWTSYFTPKQ